MRAAIWLALAVSSPRLALAQAAPPPCEELAAAADLKDLPNDDRRVFCAFAKDLIVEGCCRATLHECLKTKASCPRARMLAAVGRAAIGRGADEEAALAAAARYQAGLAWSKRKSLDLRTVPCRGAAASPTTMTVVEFADFDCPHCAAVQALLDRLLEQNKDLRLCAIAFPLHPHSNLAAAAALFAQGQGKYWEMSGALFEGQSGRQELEEGPYIERLVEASKRLGIDGAKLRAALKEGSPDLDRARAQLALAKQLELEGTPSFFLDGRPLDYEGPLLEPSIADEREFRKEHPQPK
jgi:protein-disulfide isomerase